MFKEIHSKIYIEMFFLFLKGVFPPKPTKVLVHEVGYNHLILDVVLWEGEGRGA